MSSTEVQSSNTLTKEKHRQIFQFMLEARLGDEREESLHRQGNGWFQIAGQGHEAMAALGVQLVAEDYVCPFYRDRALVLAKGLTTHDLALNFLAKRDSSSGGRQLPGHFSSRANNVWSVPSPVGAHLLPACGIAWGQQLDGEPGITVATMGEGATRQGDFHEAVCFALEKKLPILFWVEDNGISISMHNRDKNPLSLGFIDASRWLQIDGTDIDAMYDTAASTLTDIRAGNGPRFVWSTMPRLCSHSCADDHRQYLKPEELQGLDENDPLKLYRQRLVEEDIISAEELGQIEEKAKGDIRETYELAKKTNDPDPKETEAHLFGQPSNPEITTVPLQNEPRKMVEVVNQLFHTAIETNPDFLFFGEDVEDPKGGVFKLTEGLSSKYPRNAFNSPVAESTILGIACGLASYGKHPVAEIQFVDFIAPAWNQLVSNIATLRWRSFGDWSCPMVIYAPYGAYLPGGGPWHSQSNEGDFARNPGLQVIVPSTSEDAAGLTWTALHGEDPVIVLLPKHLLWGNHKKLDSAKSIPIGQARVVRKGAGLTILAWGNCLEVVDKAMKEHGLEIDVEIIDLRSLVPWDRETVRTSLLKTGHLLIVQEDTAPGSIGQMILGELLADPEIHQALKGPPQVVSRKNIHIGYNPIYENDSLPDPEQVADAIRNMGDSGGQRSISALKIPKSSASQETKKKTQAEASSGMHTIQVPILGEGIQEARIVTLFKQPGDRVELDEALCEVETAKAVFPVESSVEGTLSKWLVQEEEEVEVGQKLAHIQVMDEGSGNVTESRPTGHKSTSQPGLSKEARDQMQAVVQATVNVHVRWEAIRAARKKAKSEMGADASSPSLMVAWAVVQAMKHNKSFTALLEDEGLRMQPDDFDFGIAVALDNDALETAVVQHANRLSFKEFQKAYKAAITTVREGKPTTKVRVPLIISSMGPYHVRSATPVVVPPSIATLFVGTAHLEPVTADDGIIHQEVVTMDLTFDHRWINGVGAASFMADIRKGVEQFELPELS